ncbi:MAG: ABC transporter ATP-binding protein [Acidobacteria bacterium]|nr:ABC transporter ATP-binding protein [Acidobacteriota bacterium]
MFIKSWLINSRTRHLLTLVPFLKKYRTQITIGIFMVLATNIAAMVAPWVLKRAVDHLYHEISRELLLYYSALVVCASAVEGFFRFQMRRILIGVSRYLEYDLRNHLFAHLQRLTPRFYQQYSTGDILSRASNDLSAVRMVLGPGIMYSVNTVFTTIFTITLLLSISWKLTFLTLLPLFAVTYCVKYFGRSIHQRFESIQRQLGSITTLTQENVSGIRVVKAYNQENAFIERFKQANQDFMHRSLSLVRIWGLFYPLLTLLLGVSAASLLWYGGRQVVQGSITLGDLVAFMSYLAMLTWPTIALGWVINIFERGSASMGRINELLDHQPEVLEGGSKETLARLKGDINIRNLSFSYNGFPVLRNVDLQARAGETIAIVGSTGSGKTTLVNLLCRLYPVERGTIFIDGIDINDIPLSILRKNIGYVPQDTFLFSETVAENIAFGKPESSRLDVENAAHISNIWPEIQHFPRKFETFVGERGITLSGGQKQRIAISRALLVDSPILILDDALSSVDTYTEEQILRKLSGELKNRTALLISHRVSTVKMADQIIVLQEGRVVERGTHDELLSAGGFYADLYQKQLLREELGVE